MNFFPWFSIMTSLPFFGAIILAFLQKRPLHNRLSRWCALGSSILTLLLSLYIAYRFNYAQPGFQLREKWKILALDTTWTFVIDISMLRLVLLATFLTPLAILFAQRIKGDSRELVISFLILEALSLHHICSLLQSVTGTEVRPAVLFVEILLVPLSLITILLCGIFNSHMRIQAFLRVFGYAFIGNTFILIISFFQTKYLFFSFLFHLFQVICVLFALLIIRLMYGDSASQRNVS